MLKKYLKKGLELQKRTYLQSRIVHKKKAGVPAEQARRFLCIQLNAIGDAIMTQPAWASLKSFLPDSEIDLMCQPHIAPIFKEDPAIRRVVTASTRRYRSWIFNDPRFVRETIQRHHYDAIIDFSGLPVTAGLCAEKSTAVSIGFQRTIPSGQEKIDLGLCYDIAIPYSEAMHLRSLFFNLISPWSFDNRPVFKPVVKIAQDAQKKADELLQAKGLSGKKFIVLHPGGKWPPKTWPSESWNRLAIDLSHGLGYNVLILGGVQDQNVLQEIASGPMLLHCQTFSSDDIRLSCALIGAAHLCICNDSAAMHIAAAMGTKSIALFGPVSPHRSAPPAEEGCTFFYEDMFCSPCTLYYSKSRCRRGINFCMHAIHPERVSAKVKQILSLAFSK